MRKMLDHIVEGKPVSVGMDVSKRKYCLNVRSEGMMVHQTMLPADYDVLGGYLRKNYPRCSVAVMYEAGFSGFGLHDYLVSEGVECVVTPPTSVLVEKVDKKKCDKRDAARLAKSLESGDYRACEVPDKERREDRLATRILEATTKDLAREKNRIRRLYDMYDLTGKQTAENWKAGDWLAAREKSKEDTMVGMSLRIHFEKIDLLLQQRRELRKLLCELSKKPRYSEAVDRLESTPGIGRMTAVRLVLEWGEDWSRFATAGKIAGYSGLVSSEYSTGDDQHRGHITGQSRGAIRSWLIQSAWTAIRHDPVLMEKFRRVAKSSGSKKKAIVAVARKMVIRMRAVMLSGKHYQKGLLEERQEKKAKTGARE